MWKPLICALLGLLVFSVAGCNTRAAKVYDENIQSREDVFLKAQALYPQPSPSNFPFRRDLVKFVERQDSVSHPFYVYLFGDNGNVIGYYVAQAAPQNACNFLSDTKTEYNNILRDAPSLDGVYYGGTGASGACDEWFFFDTATDALIKIRGFKFFTADQPLRLEAAPILVEVAGGK